jgi:hypothetical protein
VRLESFGCAFYSTAQKKSDVILKVLAPIIDEMQKCKAIGAEDSMYLLALCRWARFLPVKRFVQQS